MNKLLFVIGFFIYSLNLSAQNDLPGWMQKSGWVSYSTVCETLNDLNGRNVDCSEGNFVTDAHTLFNSIHWAGEVVELYYSKSSNSFTNLKIKVRWNTSSSGYYCGQIIKRRPSEIKEFTKTSLALRKCR